jgi:hypothetical protein
LSCSGSGIDPLVHHCNILELTGPSFRTEKALNKNLYQESLLQKYNELLVEEWKERGFGGSFPRSLI